METTPTLNWTRSVTGSTDFCFVGDHKIVRFPRYVLWEESYLVQRCVDGMPTERGTTFDYLDDALSWIGE